MDDDHGPYVTLKELALELGRDSSSTRRFVLKNGIKPHRARTPGSRGQPTLILTAEDADRVRALLSGESMAADNTEQESRALNGVFYVVQVVPDLAPNRVKLGWSSDISARLGAHQTAAPTASIFKTWPCRQRWELAAMDSATRTGCSLIKNEVFECDLLDDLCARLDAFFNLMPQ